jgi:hypothetical protein
MREKGDVDRLKLDSSVEKLVEKKVNTNTE